jgi:hypothetical protein
VGIGLDAVVGVGAMVEAAVGVAAAVTMPAAVSTIPAEAVGCSVGKGRSSDRNKRQPGRPVARAARRRASRIMIREEREGEAILLIIPIRVADANMGKW